MNSEISKRLLNFIDVVLAIWVADALVKQVSFLNSLNNLWGMILVAGIIFVVLDYIIEKTLAKR